MKPMGCRSEQQVEQKASKKQAKVSKNHTMLTCPIVICPSPFVGCWLPPQRRIDNSEHNLIFSPSHSDALHGIATSPRTSRISAPSCQVELTRSRGLQSSIGDISHHTVSEIPISGVCQGAMRGMKKKMHYSVLYPSPRCIRPRFHHRPLIFPERSPEQKSII